MVIPQIYYQALWNQTRPTEPDQDQWTDPGFDLPGSWEHYFDP